MTSKSAEKRHFLPDKKTKRKENHTQMNPICIKTDCFAYQSQKHSCSALKQLYCKKGKCAFYKPIEQKRQEDEYWQGKLKNS